MHPLSQTNFRQAEGGKKTTTTSLNRFFFFLFLLPFPHFSFRSLAAFKGTVCLLRDLSRSPSCLAAFGARSACRGSAKTRGLRGGRGGVPGVSPQLQFFIRRRFNMLFFVCASCSPHHIRSCNLDYHKMIPNIWSHTFQLSHYLLQNETRGAPPPPSGRNAARFCWKCSGGRARSRSSRTCTH